MESQVIQQIYTAIDEAETIIITGHVSPDGDCLGSVLGLGLTLLEAGKKVTMAIDDDLPDRLSYMPGFDLIRREVEGDQFDLFIMVDIGDRRRLGETAAYLDSAKASICIDHHATNEMICDINLVEKSASSTCEMLGELLMEGPYLVPADGATALYTGLTTDSNRFLYKTARQDAMRVGADLLDLGADVDTIYLHEFQTLDSKLIAFTGHIVENALYLHEGKVALANLTEELLEKYKLEMSDGETVVDTLKNLEGVEVACIIKDRGDKDQKVSLRSKAYYNVAAIAQKFGGGGHIQAAGCSLDSSNEEAFQTMKAYLEQIEWPS